jgi:hypothetical protein
VPVHGDHEHPSRSQDAMEVDEAGREVPEQGEADTRTLPDEQDTRTGRRGACWTARCSCVERVCAEGVSCDWCAPLSVQWAGAGVWAVAYCQSSVHLTSLCG